MTLRLGYELGFGLACTSALLIVLLGGELPSLSWIGLIAVAVAGVLHIRGRSAPAWLGTSIGLLSLAAGFGLVISRGTETLILGATIGIVGLLIGRVLTRTELVHDLQALLLTLLLVFAGAGLHTAVSYGVVFVIYSVTVVWALVTRQLVEGAHREADRRGGAAVVTTLARRDVVTPTFFAVSALLSVVILALTLTLFVAFPRVGIGSFGMTLKGRSLPDRVSLSGPPRAGMSSQVVARVSGLAENDYLRGLYLRAAAYDRLTRDGFDRDRQSATSSNPRLQRLATTGPIKSYEVFLQPVSGTRLPTLGPIERLRIMSGGSANPSLRARVHYQGPGGNVLLDAPLSGAVRYRVHGHITTASPTPPESPVASNPAPAFAPWLELPPNIDEAVFELARGLTADDATPYERARRLRNFFLQDFEYTLAQPTAGAEDPLSAFVLDVKAGHCEHFATAFATMLRAAGVPARVVGGFQGGIWDDSSNTVVFGLNNAHAWVEWYQPGVGWVTDDATPAFIGDTLSPLAMWMERVRRAWDDYVVDYGLMEQAAIAANVGRQIRRFTSNHPRLSRNWLQPLAIGLAGLAWVLIGIHFWRRRRARISEDGLAQAIQRALEDETKSSLPAQQTFQETLDTIPDLPPWRAELLRHAIAHYHSRRFGDARLNVSRELELVQGLNQLHRAGPAYAGYGAD